MSATTWDQADYAPTRAEAEADEATVCPLDEPCALATSCPFCDEPLCADHAPEAVDCVGDRPVVLHHWGCRNDCADCQAFFAEERAAKAGEDW